MIADIVIRFQGVLANPTALAPENILPAALMEKYRADRLLRGGDRTLTRMGTQTNTIGVASTTLITTFVQQVRDVLANAELGKIYIYGTSSGGRNAIALGEALTAANIPVAFVAAMDAAWFPNEATNRPDRVPEPSNPPEFSTAPALTQSSADKYNYYQTVGNQSEKTWLHGEMFTSRLAGKEVHGRVAGFTNQSMNSTVRAKAPKDDDDAAHRELSKAAIPIVQLLISGGLGNIAYD